MSRNKTFDEAVRSQHDARVWADETGKALVKQESGKYWSVSTEIGTVHLNDCCRTIPKQERELIKQWFKVLGLLTVFALVVGVSWLMVVA